jgi:PAS domain S-box-containing protein
VEELGGRIYETIKFPVLKDGTPFVIAGFTMDITERKRAEEALRESEECYRQLLNHAPAGIYEVDFTRQKFVAVNDVMCKYLGYTEKELLSMNAFDLLTEESRALYDERLQRLFAKEKVSETVEYKIKAKGGREMWAVLHPNYIYVDGKLKGAAVVAHDITERKLAEEAFRESERRYRLLAENVTDVIWMRDMDMQFTYVSPSVEKMTGYSVEEAMALAIEQSYTPESLRRAMEAFQEELELEKDERSDPGRTRTLELEGYRKDGSKTWTEAKVKFVRDSDGKPTGLLGISRDITERKRAEVVLQERQKQLDIKSKNLEEVNTALRVLLKKRAEDQDEFQERVLLNVKELVEPYLEKLRKSQLDEFQKSHLEILESNLKEIVSPFAKKLSSIQYGLTPMEIRVANLIKDGRTTKEIAELANLSIRAIEFHRENLRKKLGITNKKTNLRSYLSSLP